MIDEMGRGFAHAPRATTGTEAAPLAAERNERRATAAGAHDPREAVGQDAAAEEGAELAHDEARKGSAIRIGGEAREEGLQVFGEELIERGLLRLAAAVAAGL